MKSAGDGASPPMASTGDETVRIRLYRRAVEDGTLVAVAELDPVAPLRPLDGGAASPVEEVDAEHDPGSGLYLALVQDGIVFDLALLCFSGGQPELVGDGDEVLDVSSSEEDDEEGEEEGVASDEQDEAHVKEEASEEDVQKQRLQIQLRAWPSKNRVVVKVFRGRRWVLTKEYSMIWLQDEELEEMSSQNCFQMGFGAPCATTSVFRNTDCVVDFEVITIVSPVLDELINDVFKPSMADFKIVRKLGGDGACRVFKCIFLGSECALKAISQEVGCITEPREIEIISNLKDKRVMTFYQAWTESWWYKQRPKEYIFIHLEFCPRTLKDALLPENCNWISNQWFVFEEIVRAVNFFHGEGVVHRDLKPDNIFFGSDWGVRIGDFGDACVGRDEFGLCGGTPGCGTKYYLAPELDSGEKITEKVDVYSIGVIFFELFSSFKTVSQRFKIFPTLRDKGPPEGWKGDGEFYKKMTALEPSERPSAADILEYIEQRCQVDAPSDCDT